LLDPTPPIAKLLSLLLYARSFKGEQAMGQRSFTNLTLLILILSPLALVRAAHAADGKPNILYIIADDLGWKDVGFHGSDIHTPTIDKLAAGGARLEQFYAQPFCTPTRAAILTGRYPFRYGLQTAVIPSSHTYGLPTDEYLLPQALKDVSYQTAIIGKWHLGHGDHKYWPRQRGFDYQYGPLIGELDYFTHEQHGVIDWFRNNEQVKEEGYTTTLLGDEAVKLIGQHDANTPLFLYLAFNAPHTPYQATQEYLDRYKTIEDPSRRAYAGSITAMDDQIARVLDALDQKGMRQNTLIIFQSDNGGTRNKMFSGELDMSKVTIPCDNGPYRDGKGSLYEGGTRVCACVNWPGHIPAGSTVNGMIHVVDMYPTLASITGASTEKCKPLDGLNVWPTISTGSESPRTEVIYNLEPFRAGVRQGDWKLVWRTPLPASVELYNIAQDPSEKSDVAAQHADKVAQLQKRANDLSATMAKPMLLQTEFKAVQERLKLPPALPNEDFMFDEED
jgi:arylsulfatase A-like enzyme